MRIMRMYRHVAIFALSSRKALASTGVLAFIAFLLVNDLGGLPLTFITLTCPLRVLM